MEAKTDKLDQPKLVTIGYISSARRPFAWLPPTLLVVAVIGLILGLVMTDGFVGVAIILGFVAFVLIYSSFLPRPRFRWVNADGSNSHVFASPSPPTLWVNVEPKQLDGGFRNEVIADPNLGDLQTLYTDKTWVARHEDRKVFEVRRIRGRHKLEAVAGNPNLASARYEVVADLRLHPDTIEQLVEKFATGHDQRQVYGYVLTRGSD